MAAWLKRREIRVFDSLGNPRSEEAGCVKDYFTVIVQESGENPFVEMWWIEGTFPDTPRQTDGVSC